MRNTFNVSAVYIPMSVKEAARKTIFNGASLATQTVKKRNINSGKQNWFLNAPRFTAKAASEIGILNERTENEKSVINCSRADRGQRRFRV